MVMEEMKQTREERGEKEENMTRLQQLALSEGCLWATGRFVPT